MATEEATRQEDLEAQKNRPDREAGQASFEQSGYAATSVNGASGDWGSALDDFPEVVLGAAFVGGFLLGRLVRRLGS
jgi:hypothetical protein